MTLVPFLSVYGQQPIVVSEDSVKVGAGFYPGFAVTIPEADYNLTLKNWVNELESGTKSKVVTENGVMSIFGANMKNISPNPVNIYSILENEDTLNILLVCIELRKDEYLDQSGGDSQITTTKNFLKEFARTQYTSFIKEEIDREEKVLNDLEKELNGLESNKAKAEKNAKESMFDIENAEEKLLLQNNELNLLSNRIVEENREMMAMKAGPSKDARAAQVKTLEKERKKLQKDIGKTEKSIRKAKSTVNDTEKMIPKNEEEQNKMIEKIELQKGVVQKYVDKLNTVKSY
jgi:hypothetical protein